MIRLRYALLLLLMLGCCAAYGQRAGDKRHQVYKDTMAYNYFSDSIRSDNFFNSVIIRNLFSNPSPKQTLDDNQYEFEDYRGKVIDSIFIFRYNVFDDTVKSKFINWTLRRANSIHTVTKEKHIRRELLFKSGQRLNPSLISANEYLLRSRLFLSKAFIIPEYKMHDPQSDSVNIYVFTQDSWSWGIDASYRKNRYYDSYFTLYDDNFLGDGNQIRITNYFNLKRKELSNGVEIGYLDQNVLGTFFDADFALGIGKKKHVYSAVLNKDFFISNDYAGGVGYTNRRFRELQIASPVDTTIVTHYSLLEFWAGKSWEINRNETNVYLTVKGQRKKFKERAEVAEDLNPYYHSQDMILSSVGFYNEKFYKGNLIYGFGNIEDIPYGYKLEMVTGRRWSEFRNRWYMGANLSGGNLFSFGYLAHSSEFGTFMKKGYKPVQTILNAELMYFSNLLSFSSRFHFRQFLNVYYTGGYNMLKGQREIINFTASWKLRGLSEPDIYGTSRLIISPQSVLFTPVHLYGFRFAFFTYMDMGFLGYKENPFNNDFYSAIGVGIRLRNERLIFRTLQLRISFALNKSGSGKNRLFNLSHEDRLRHLRFIPRDPNTITFL